MHVLPSASGAFGEWVVHLACLGVLGANPVTLASDLTSGALIRQVRCKGYRRCAKRTKAGKVHDPTPVGPDADGRTCTRAKCLLYIRCCDISPTTSKADAAKSQSRPGKVSDKPKIKAEDFKV